MFDTESGLHYNYHRYYDPSIGRYITPDPIGLSGGINLYGYADLNPINAYDPDGKIPVLSTSIIGGASGALSGLYTGYKTGSVKAAIAGGIFGGIAGAIVGAYNPFGSSAAGILAGNIAAGFVGGAVGGYTSAAIDPDPCANKLESATTGSIIGALSGALAAPITYLGSVGVVGSGYAPWVNATAVSVASESVAIPTVLTGSHLIP